MFIDIGVNLFNNQFRNKEKTVQDALTRNVQCIITGTDGFSSNIASAFCDIFNKGKPVNKKIFFTSGIHPHNASHTKDEDYETLRFLSTDTNNVAIGECGLDYDRMYSKKEDQIKVFLKQIEIAEKLNKPLFLHERAAFNDFYNILKEHELVSAKSVIHCFTGTKEAVKKYLDLGCFIGITGWICDQRRNKDLIEAIKYIPLDRLMIETDSPYLLPLNSGINTPSNIPYISDFIANILGIEKGRFEQIIYKNTTEFFNIK